MFYKFNFFPLFYLLINCIFNVCCVDVPPNPCPDIFQYLQDKNSNYYGLVTIPYTDGSKFNITTAVGGWMPGYHPEINTHHLELTMTTPYEKLIKNTTSSIVYHVDFPFNYVVPIISIIALNEKIYCTGPPIPPNDGSTEFTTCGQTHYLDFPSSLVCQQNQANENQGQYVGISLCNENMQTSDAPYSYSTPSSTEAPIVDQTDPPPVINHNHLNGQTQYVDVSLPNNENRHQIYTKPVDETVNDISEISKATESSIKSFNNYNDICGRPATTTSLIYYGDDVPMGAYPWLVAIFRKLRGYSLNYICAGSLVSTKHVITAAHCFFDLSKRRIKNREFLCLLGKLNLDDWESDSSEKRIQPETIMLHSEYEIGKSNADIAVITFPDPIKFTQVIRPLCLWQGSNDLKEVVGTLGTVVGWGKQENEDADATEPKQVTMPIVDQWACLNTTTAAKHGLLELISPNTFCAGFRNGSGPCAGDSGSAFLIKKNDIFYLKGIVSAALSNATHRSCNLMEYVVFTDASKYLDWITHRLV